MIVTGPDFKQDISDIRSKISNLPTSYSRGEDVDRAVRDLKEALLGITEVLAGLNKHLNEKK